MSPARARARAPEALRCAASPAEAKLAVFDYIEAFYNPQRRHSALDYLSPADFERRYRSETITSAA